MSCLFCRIVAREIPATLVYDDPHVVAFRDLHPVAPTHVLVVPRVHIASLADADEVHTEALGRVLQGVAAVARTLGIVDGGYRTVINHGADAGQSVFHLHAHVLAGRVLAWPPG